MKSFVLPLVLLVSQAGVTASETALRNWPSWRGPLGSGVAPLAQPPVTWSETNHVKWKVEVPGSGNASPVVWEDQIFVLTAIPTGDKIVLPLVAESPPPPAAVEPPPAAGGTNARPRGGGGGGRNQVERPDQAQEFTVIAYDRATGNVRWRHSPRTELPHEGHHKDHGYASASPVTDGEVLLAHFGSRGLHAYDLAGRPLWRQDFGRLISRNGFGEGSTPALHGDTVLVVWDHEGEDFIVALDKRTGKKRWRKSREESTNWSTPLILEHEGRAQAVVNSGNKVRSYDLATGETVWEAGGQTQNAVPAPVAGHGRVYVTSGWRGAAFQAITLGRTGDLTGTDAIAWSHARNTPYVPSPLLYGDQLYFFSVNNAQLSILDARDGRVAVDAERLEGIFNVYASPVGAADRVYLTGRNGVVWVIRNAPALEVLAKNRLDDGFDATPALAGREIILRGKKHLYLIADSSLAVR